MASLLEEVKVEFAVVKLGFKRYFKFKGRSSRSEYLRWVLFLIVASIITNVVDLVALGTASWGNGPITVLVSCAFAIPTLAITIRRLHDTNKSAWWFLLPLVNLWFVAIKAGDEQPNRYD